MRAFVVGAMVGIIVVAGCNDATGPKSHSVQRVATIYNIKVPARAAFGDTVRIAFNYAPFGCDSGVVFQARPTADGMRFTATSWSTELPCAYLRIMDPLASSVGYVVNPPHNAPLRLVFTEPDGKDSVRVVGS